MGTELILCPLMLLPWRVISMPATFFQLRSVAVSCSLANCGCTAICKTALIFSLLDDGWHRPVWSKALLASWGYKEGSRESGDSEKDSASEVRPSYGITFLVIILGFL